MVLLSCLLMKRPRRSVGVFEVSCDHSHDLPVWHTGSSNSKRMIGPRVQEPGFRVMLILMIVVSLLVVVMMNGTVMTKRKR